MVSTRSITRRPGGDAPAGAAADELAAIERNLVAFVRAFGLHQGDVTPCGEPISVSEAHAVAELAADGPLSQRALGDRLALAKGTVSHVVDLLEGREWARRVRSTSDARVVEVRLTPAGRAAARRLATRRRARLARLLDAVPAARRPDVIDALALLTEAARADR
jgi:DNA-binding MarR family transcriptional regulator